MPFDSEYSVERRGGKYYLYRPDGSKMPGQEAFSSDLVGIARLYKMAAELNRKTNKNRTIWKD